MIYDIYSDNTYLAMSDLVVSDATTNENSVYILSQTSRSSTRKSIWVMDKSSKNTTCLKTNILSRNCAAMELDGRYDILYVICMKQLLSMTVNGENVKRLWPLRKTHPSLKTAFDQTLGVLFYFSLTRIRKLDVSSGENGIMCQSSKIPDSLFFANDHLYYSVHGLKTEFRRCENRKTILIYPVPRTKKILIGE